MDTVIARFKGEDGSLGYRTGRTYVLWVEAVEGVRYPVTIVRPTRCPYASFDAFHRNWVTIHAFHGEELGVPGRYKGPLAKGGFLLLPWLRSWWSKAGRASSST